MRSWFRSSNDSANRLGGPAVRRTRGPTELPGALRTTAALDRSSGSWMSRCVGHEQGRCGRRTGRLLSELSKGLVPSNGRRKESEQGSDRAGTVSRRSSGSASAGVRRRHPRQSPRPGWVASDGVEPSEIACARALAGAREELYHGWPWTAEVRVRGASASGARIGRRVSWSKLDAARYAVSGNASCSTRTSRTGSSRWHRVDGQFGNVWGVAQGTLILAQARQASGAPTASTTRIASQQAACLTPMDGARSVWQCLSSTAESTSGSDTVAAQRRSWEHGCCRCSYAAIASCSVASGS